MIASFFAASFGIIVMIFASPLRVSMAFRFGPPEIFAIMLVGLVCGGTMSRGSALKGIAMTLVGLLVGVVGTDTNSGTTRFTFGFIELSDKVELVALALGLFGMSEFLRSVNRMETVSAGRLNLRLRDMRPSRADVKQAFMPAMRGTLIGTLFGALPGTGPTITTFIAYAFEQKIARRPERFGQGAIEGVASPEAASHSKTQVDFIPTMSLGIPGDATMALILGALLIQGIQPGPQLITEHADIFWGLIASFWIGNVLLVLLNVPLIGVWVKLLQVPYRYLYPSALFFIAVGVYSTNNSLFEVGEVVAFGLAGALFLALDFPVAPILLGFVLGPMVEENFRRSLLLSQGDMSIFFNRPISASFIAMAGVVVAVQLFFACRGAMRRRLNTARA
jgi:putative tricarboxylic transport membrane protein